MNKIYYAKPDQTYEEHLEAVYVAWKETVTAKRRLIERLADKYDFSIERFLQGSLLTVVLHDIGKMIEPFQDMMKALRGGKRFDYKKNYRHELISFLATFVGANFLNKSSLYSKWPLEAIAVLGHHKALNFDLTSFEREKITNKPKLYDDGIAFSLELANEIFGRENWQLPIIPEKTIKANGLNKVAELFEIIRELKGLENSVRIRTLYILTKGILHYADWHGSGRVPVNYTVSCSNDEIIEKIRERCLQKGISFTGLRLFQNEVAAQSSHVIAIAPTGSGKTEASLLWAMKNSGEMGGAKVIYLLPTMATANSIWLRLNQFFGVDNVGLTHSSASLMLESEQEADSEKNNDCRNLLFDQTFMRPVTVGTVDQLLNTGFNIGYWTIKEINAANAVIVLDEIHAYDGWTLGLILATIKHFAGLGARFLLMSATMPKGLIKTITRVLPNVNIIEDTDLLNAQRSKYYVVDKLITEANNDIRKAVIVGHKVLVVVNTVECCQLLAKDLHDLDPICYHSRFILRDRKNIEERMENARLIIATQIVEVSLDIDFDWLFTECAPPDAIAQRAGRINRYRDPGRDSRIYIYRADEKSKKIYDPINDPELLKRSFDEFLRSPKDVTEKSLLEIIEKVYEDDCFEEREGFQEALNQYESSQEIRFSILDNRLNENELEKTRMTKYETISVIPYCFYSDIMEMTTKERKWFEVKIPYWYFARNNKQNNGILFCDMEYDSTFGAFLKTDDKSIFV
ncbi:MAG: CRISPR-associated helicase Cas3' [Bacillota bacterium]|jgi:CRISPR-associated endonuclease/helicase Cas3